LTENAGAENEGPKKNKGCQYRTVKCGTNNAECMGGKCRTGKCGIEIAGLEVTLNELGPKNQKFAPFFVPSRRHLAP